MRKETPPSWKMLMETKRILIFVPEFPRLTETFIQREISKLIELGNLDITVFSLKKASGKLLANVQDHVVYKRLNVFSLIIAFLYFGFKFPQRLFSSFKLFVVNSENEENVSVSLFLKSVGYTYLFSCLSPDHIHANFMSWPSTVAMIASSLLDIPYSISAHAKDVMVEGEHFCSKVRSAKFISICNKFAYKYCVDHAGVKDPKNVLLQYHGVDPKEAFSDISNIEKPDRPLLFNGGSRLVEKKGQKYLIEVAKILKGNGYNFEVHIAGPGPLYETLLAQIKDSGLEDCVFIHGGGKGVPFSTVVSYLKIADIVVQPNINLGSGDSDGIPTFVIESALMAKPIVATDAGSITDLIENEKTGLVVGQRNSQAFAEAVEKVLKDPDLCVRLGEAAKARAERMFDLDKNVKELEKLLLE